MDHIDKTINELKQKVVEKEQELIEAKKTVNSLCTMVGKQPLYVIEDVSNDVATVELRGDEYYGRPLATVLTNILVNRKIRGSGPAAVKELHSQMVSGGYQFDAKSDTNAMRGLRISMAKNKKFHKLPNGKWGLKEWYPNIKDSKEANAQTKAENGIVSEILSKNEENADTAKND